MKLLVALVPMALLAACAEQSSADAGILADIKPVWRSLPDGSSFAITTPSGKDAETLVRVGARCWPESDGGFICMMARQMVGAVNVTSVSYGEESGLPDYMLGDAGGAAHQCYALMGNVVEQLKRGNSVLVSGAAGQWSRGYVRKYIADNQLSGDWFRCVDIVRAVEGGSLETLSTTTITRDMLPK